jgi:glycosyltransferase involved in cell wall biosynthesis
MTAGRDSATAPRPRIAYLSYSSGEFDARALRMARSAIDAGYDVTIYARWHPGLPPVEVVEGIRLVRAPFDERLAIPGLRGRARRRAATAMAAAAREHETRSGSDDRPTTPVAIGANALGPTGTPGGHGPVRRLIAPLVRPLSRRWRLLVKFPIRPIAWARALDEVVEPADIWHGMWAGSLPALLRLQRRHGGRTIYDSRDVYLESRDFATMGEPGRTFLAALERRWARRVDHILTVNDAYADLLARQLRLPRPTIVMNCPVAWAPPEPPPDRIRAALDLPPETRVALYQGQLMSDRGIEESMAAILEVDGAVLALLGFGPWAQRLRDEVSVPPYVGRVRVLPPVTPGDLLDWTASADVMVMAIQPTSTNHRFTTPQKLFESIAAGVPVVASDLPGMAGVVRDSGVGVLCDPTDPSAIADAIREVLSASPAEAAARRERILAVARERYTWDRQAEVLLRVYRSLLDDGKRSRTEA